jgi:hypothetical protein
VALVHHSLFSSTGKMKSGIFKIPLKIIKINAHIHWLMLNEISTLCKIKVCLVNGHGRLMDPPARNAMWRFGFPNPVDYQDNELYCGGFSSIAYLL